MIKAEQFYTLFLEEVKRSNIESLPWVSSKQWTRKMLKGENCVLANMAKRLGLLYCHEYFSLDGIFFRKKVEFMNKNIGSNYYAQNIEVIIEHENAQRTIETEINKLIPLFIAPLKVIITYIEYEKEINKIERIKNLIVERIKNDDPFLMHKNKIEILLIIGFKKGWKGYILKNCKYETIA